MKKVNKYGAFRVISRWLDLLPRLFALWRVFLGYTFVITLCGIILNRWSYSCSGEADRFWCNWYGNSPKLLFASVILNGILALLFYIVFACDFYNNLIHKQNFEIKSIFRVSKQKLKSVWVLLVFVAIMILSCGTLMYIINPLQMPTWHSVNPDWRIEFIYFTIAFISASIPLMIMRCAGIIAYFFNEGQLPFRKIYNLTLGRAYVGIFCFLLLVLLCLNLHFGIVRYFNGVTEKYDLVTTAVVTEFCGNFIMLIYIALFLLLFQSEYLVLKEKEAQDQADNEPKVIEQPQTNDGAEKTSVKRQTKKSANKKQSQRKTSHKKSQGD